MTHVKRPTYNAERRGSQASQFWVVGGEYTDTEFTALHGPAEALGPFSDYAHAYQEWERLSMETKPSAHVRYTIVGSLPR